MKSIVRLAKVPLVRASGKNSPAAAGLRALLMLLLVGFATGAPLRAQSVESQLQEMRQSIHALQQQVKTLQKQLRETRVTLAQDEKTRAGASPVLAESADPKPAAPAGEAAQASSSYATPAQQSDTQQAQAEAESKTSLLESEISDLAQTKVGSNSRFPVKIFGTIVSDASFNSGAVNWLDNPSFALPPLVPGVSTNSFSVSLRQSRLGAIINGPTLGDWKTSGLIMADFFAGSTALSPDTTMPVPRLLYGYVRFERGNTLIEAGQDQMILAPLNPTSIAALSFPELYDAGNLYSRAPQVRIQQTFKADASNEFIATAGVLDADAGDANIIAALGFANGPAEAAHRPAVQARLAWKWNGGDSKHFEIGASGHRGSELFPTGSQPSWGEALDVDAQDHRLGFAGEFYSGRNLAPFGGSIGQFGKSIGGFAEARFKASERLSFNSGFGTDHLYDLRRFSAPWIRNSGFYVNSIFQFTPEVAGSVEYRRLSLVPATLVLHRDNFLDLVLAYSF